MAVFACARCGTALTGAVSRVALPVHARQRYGHLLLPALMAPGTYAVDPEPAGPPWRSWSEIGADEAEARNVFAPVPSLSFGAPGAIVLAPGDTRSTVLIPERCDGRCMGLDGRDGPNLACANCGQAVATRIDDCSYWQSTRLAPNAVRRVPGDGPTPRPVEWAVLAEERESTPPVEPSGHWSPRWEAAVGSALAHLLVASAGAPVTLPGGLVTSAFGRALDALLPRELPTKGLALAGPGLPPRTLLPTSPWCHGTRRPGGRGSRPALPLPCRWPPTCGCIWPSTTNGRPSLSRAGRPRVSSATIRCRCTHPTCSGPTRPCSSTRWPGCLRSVSRGCAGSTTA
ncbi:hypothetical protein GCM10025734_07670 [Kitasatospora paranensis]